MIRYLLRRILQAVPERLAQVAQESASRFQRGQRAATN